MEPVPTRQDPETPDCAHPLGISMRSNIITAGRDNIFNVSTGVPHNPFADMRRLAAWLSPLNSHQIHKDVLEKVTKGTGSWIFEHPKFIDWSSKKIDVLWGTGIPGVGKTCIASIVIDHLTNHRQATVLYIYCQYKDSLSTADLLACILKQIVESSAEAAKFVSKTLQELCLRTDTRPSKSELLATIQGTLQILSTEIVVVVDALDELRSNVRPEFVRDLISLQQPLFMTSRPLTDLPKFKEPDFIILAPDGDINKFLSSRIDDIPKLEPYLRAPDVRAQVINQIQEKCQGMFLLAALQIDALASGGVVDTLSLQDVINQLPTTLYERYTLTLERIRNQNPREHNLACRAIVLVTHSFWSLEVEELLEALAVDLETESFEKARRTAEETLIRVCCGLLTIEKESRTVHLIHYTAQSFFESRDDLIFNDPHDFIANISAIYLTQLDLIPDTQTELSALEHVAPSHPFVLYACRYIGYHSSRVSQCCNGRVPVHVHMLFRKRPSIPILLPAFGNHIDHGKAIHFAALHGLVSLFEENRLFFNLNSALGCSSLFYACLGGHTTIVEQILGTKSEPFLKVGFPTMFGATVLHAACQSGDLSVVRLLLPLTGPKSGFFSEKTIQYLCGYEPIDINARMSHERSALHIASQDGNIPILDALLSHDSTETPTPSSQASSFSRHSPQSTKAYSSTIVRSLLQGTRIDVNAQDGSGWTPLHWAIAYGHNSVARRLLDAPNINVNIAARDRWTPLHISALRGRGVIASMLLNSPGIDIDIPALKTRTALHLAAQNGHENVAQLLLEHSDVGLNARDHSGHTPLHLAAKNGHESVIRLLLRFPNTDLNAKNHLLDTPLHLAALNGHVDAVRILLSSPDVNANAENDKKGTPLLLAAEKGHEGVVQLLLRFDAVNVNASTVDGLTPLHVASYMGYETVVRTLLTSPQIDINVKNLEEYIPLHLAAQNGHDDIVQLFLLSTDVDINIQASRGWMALHLAAQNGHAAVVRVLLERPGVDVNGRAFRERTPLHQSSQGGHRTIVETLLSHPDIDVNAQDENGMTPLHLSAIMEYESVLRLLLTSINIDPNIKDGTESTVLHSAAISGRDSIVRLLLSYPNVNVNMKGVEETTALHAAVARSHEVVVQLLLTSPNIDVNAEAASGWTPIHLAACTGNETIIALLLNSADIRVNAQNGIGWTPLHYAVQTESVGVVRLLLNPSGANVHIRGTAPSDKTPLEMAEEQGNLHILAAFEETGPSQLDIGSREGS